MTRRSTFVIFFLLCFLGTTLPVRGEEEAHPKKEDASKGEGHGKDHGEASKQPETPQQKMYREARDYIRTPYYVHQWVDFPEVKGTNLAGEPVSLKSKTGYLTVLFFVASWCLSCQNLIEDFKAIQQKTSKLSIQYAYIFMHDTTKDIKGFKDYYKIDPLIIADNAVMKIFHNPPLASIYIGDKEGNLLSRYLDVKKTDLDDLLQMLKALTIS